ncbi:hypothetical protein [Micromonospora sp. WMMD1082]|uniref:hypothetical protein n=1 Tax=Micromonospora sp. WMMD1082 TaxID=3016104 RepID=UPI002416278F|nr:hypothetical protein [Micromonospora sp. WMMD1082]MDG4795158.1 hypothetical protein [Micromonospora sp. WMMD1082]
MIIPNVLVAAARTRIPSPRRAGQCMSRAELADAVNDALHQLHPRRKLDALYVDRRWIGKLERGEHRWPSPERRAALRHVLNAADDTDLGLYNPRRTDSGGTVPGPRSVARGPAAGLDLSALRACLDAFDVPPDGPIRTEADLGAAVDSVVRLRLTSHYHQIAAVVPALLDELHRAQLVWIGARRIHAAALLTQVYRAADALADKFGYHDISARNHSP